MSTPLSPDSMRAGQPKCSWSTAMAVATPIRISGAICSTRVQQIMKDAPFDAYFDLVTPKAYDAVAVVGMHSKTGSRGFAAHTFTLGIGILINGQPITETELVALSWGRQGIPVIFASGDDRLADDLKTMPWIEYVTVKTATAADSADPRPVEEARADLTAHAQKAVENLRVGKAQAMRVPGKLRAGLKAVPPASLAMFDGIPGIPYSDSTLFFEADSLRHAYDILVQLIGVATSGSTAPLTRTRRRLCRRASAPRPQRQAPTHLVRLRIGTVAANAAASRHYRSTTGPRVPLNSLLCLASDCRHRPVGRRHG